MDDLSKQQLILLALLVSFVTSLATGIVTVSLMDQAPKGVVQTINKVVERTIERVVMQESQTAAVAEVQKDTFVSVVDGISNSIVRVTEKNSDKIHGQGIFIAPKGIIVTDKSILKDIKNIEIILKDETRMPASVVQNQVKGDIVFLEVNSTTTSNAGFPFAESATTTAVGKDVYALSSYPILMLGTGMVTQVTETELTASIDASKIVPGTALFDADGKVHGMYISPLKKGIESQFFPMGKIRE